jgi:ribulose 1,5-bisphosphate synthetase/thiazole synthase
MSAKAIGSHLKLSELPVAVIGGGPAGLAAAAHLAAKSQKFVVLEAGQGVGANVGPGGTCRCFRHGATTSTRSPAPPWPRGRDVSS